MEIKCDLQVDVNGQHIFWVNKEIFAQFSSKLSNIFEKKCKNGGKEMKVIFQDFPGGPAGFELITRFIYNNGVIDITHSNILFLNHVARFMEMNKVVFGRPSLMDRTEKFLEEIDLWDWSELLLALSNGQQRLLINIILISSVRRLVGEVVERVASRSLTTPSSLSSKCSSFRSSYDSKSTLVSTKSGYFRMFWWFEDLSMILNIDLIELLVKKMVLEKFDHLTISKFLFYYQRVRVFRVTNIVVRVKIVEKIINLLSLLDKRIISIKGLFETLRISSSLKLKQQYMSKLEILIGLQLDQASLDDLLLPSPLRAKKCIMYNVNIVLRFLKNFLLDGNISHKLCSYRLKRVARLVDLYANEIAPDHRLKPSMFVALTMVIPDSARDTCDKIYQSIEIFLEVHPKLNEEQKIQICEALNYNKLSPQVLNRLSRNTNFPLLAIVQAVIHQNPNLKRSIKDNNHLKVFRNLSCKGHEAKSFVSRDKVFIKELAKNEKFRVHLQEMGWTVLELESIFGKLQTHHYVTNVMTTPKVCCVHNVKHLPKLCS